MIEIITYLSENKKEVIYYNTSSRNFKIQHVSDGVYSASRVFDIIENYLEVHDTYIKYKLNNSIYHEVFKFSLTPEHRTIRKYQRDLLEAALPLFQKHFPEILI